MAPLRMIQLLWSVALTIADITLREKDMETRVNLYVQINNQASAKTYLQIPSEMQILSTHLEAREFLARSNKV